MATIGQNEEFVKVALRCRPISKIGITSNSTEIVQIDTERGEVIINNPHSEGGDKKNIFKFDIVIDQESSQENVYNKIALPLVDSVLEGFNGTIFTYGESAAGKTYTMEGNNTNHDNRGIIPRTFEYIYKFIENTPSKQFLVRASYLDIYKEEIRDLLVKNTNKKIQLKENPDKEIYVEDLSSYIIQNPEKMKEIHAQGCAKRKAGVTSMNSNSIRSHSFFQIIVEIREVINGQQQIKVGKLNLIDLAGLEHIQKSFVTKGQLFDEAMSVNQSLTTLGNVISALAKRKPYIPFRDSTLTKLLKDSLGGNTKTIMITNIDPADCYYKQTIQILEVAKRAKNIKNRPKININPKNAMIRELQTEINHLNNELVKNLSVQNQEKNIKQIEEINSQIIYGGKEKINEEKKNQSINN